MAKQKFEEGAPLRSCSGTAIFVFCFKPRKRKDAGPDEKEKYGISLLVPKDGTKEQKAWVKSMRSLYDEIVKDTWKKKPKSLQKPWDDGDGEDWEGTEYEDIMKGNWIFKFSSLFEIDMVGKNGRALKEEDLYAGCEVRIGYVAKHYKDMPSNGVSLYVNAILKVADGDRIGGSRMSAKTMFEDYIDDDWDGDDDDDDDDDYSSGL